MNSESKIIDRYAAMELDSEAETYLHTHARRFAYLWRMVQKVRSNFGNGPIRVMDIGPSFFTDILQSNLEDDDLYTLGFAHEASRGGHFPPVIKINKDHFHAFDLNDAQYPEKWIAPPKMDIVVMAEVLEHLYTSPVHVFRFIASIMNPGGFLIIGTPNAVALERRLRLLAGSNPYEMIRETRDNPGHFREYTVPELRQMADQAGLETVDFEIKNYFTRNTRAGVWYDKLVDLLLPANFRTGINIIFKKPD